jgi:hypothetical protein
MDPKTKIKISRNGLNRGEFELWQITALIKSGEILSTDHYWYDGMAEWKLVTEIIKLAQIADSEFKSTNSQPPPLPKSSATSTDSNQDQLKKESKVKIREKGNSIVGGFIFIVGVLVLLKGLFSNPYDSAVREAVLYQEMTNGILLMILGTLM